MAERIRSGVRGSSVTLTPNGESASLTAFTTAGGAPIALPGLIEGLGHAAGSVPLVGPVTGWLATAAASAVVGLVVGGVVVAILHFIPRKRAAH